MKNVKQGHLKPVVCLDAGHCGKQNPSPVAPMFYESQINWKLHNLLATRLEEYGIQVTKTRANRDEDLELVARGKKAKDADLFISIHVNAAENPKANYVLGVHMVDDDCGEMDDGSKQIAKLLAACVANVMGVKAETWTRQSSCDRDGNGHKDDYYGVLRGAHSVGTAGVIMEHGFYTNPEQANYLLNDNNLWTIVEAEAKVIADWFDIELQKPEQQVQVKLVGNPYKLELISLRKGSRGPQIETLQILLIASGCSCGESGVDGSFGPQTEQALITYQKRNGLTADGIAGPATFRALLGYPVML